MWSSLMADLAVIYSGPSPKAGRSQRDWFISHAQQEVPSLSAQEADWWNSVGQGLMRQMDLAQALEQEYYLRGFTE